MHVFYVPFPVHIYKTPPTIATRVKKRRTVVEPMWIRREDGRVYSTDRCPQGGRERKRRLLRKAVPETRNGTNGTCHGQRDVPVHCRRHERICRRLLCVKDMRASATAAAASARLHHFPHILEHERRLLFVPHPPAHQLVTKLWVLGGLYHATNGKKGNRTIRW